MQQIIFPKRIVKSGNVKEVKNLLIKKDLQIDLYEPRVSIFESGYVILDFGKEMCGGIHILTHSSDMKNVRVRFGESLTECSAELGGAQNATNDHSPRDIISFVPRYSNLSLGQTGFRFVRLDFSGNVRVKSVYAVNNIYKKPMIYNYKGDDKLIKKIFDTAKRTGDLCASSGLFWDGVKRDRLVWGGDLVYGGLGLTAIYGKTDIVENTIDYIREHSPLPYWTNIHYFGGSFMWIIAVANYLIETNRVDFVKKQIPYIKGLVGQMLKHVGENGEWKYPEGLFDWTAKGNENDTLVGLRATNILCAKATIFLFDKFGEDSSDAKDLLTRLLKVPMNVESSKAALAIKHFAVGLTEEDKQKLVVGGAKGFSPSLCYFILTAIASFDKQKAIDIMKEYFGAMLDKGATTFWEGFEIEWAEGSSRIDRFPKKGQKDIHGDFGKECYVGFRNSLCHGWGASLLRFIKETC